MRRAPAILLLAVFSLSLIGPVLSPGADSNLPACCRRDGKHHCAMSTPDMDDPASSAPALQAATTRCPSFPKGGALLPQSGPALLPAAPTSYIATLAQPPAPSQPAPATRFTTGSHPKRGPPTLPS